MALSPWASWPGGSPSVILFRELAVTGLRFWVIRRGVIAASRGGKAKTLLQVVAIEPLHPAGPGRHCPRGGDGGGRGRDPGDGHRLRGQGHAAAPGGAAGQPGARHRRRRRDRGRGGRRAGRAGRARSSRRADRARPDGRRRRVAHRRPARRRSHQRARRVRRLPRRGGRLCHGPQGRAARRARGTCWTARGRAIPTWPRRWRPGCRRRLAATVGAATTGVAGPDPADGQPVGTVYIAVRRPARPRRMGACRAVAGPVRLPGRDPAGAPWRSACA